MSNEATGREQRRVELLRQAAERPSVVDALRTFQEARLRVPVVPPIVTSPVRYSTGAN